MQLQQNVRVTFVSGKYALKLPHNGANSKYFVKIANNNIKKLHMYPCNTQYTLNNS